MLLRFCDWLRDGARRRQQPSYQALGRRGEDLAHRYLQERGYTVVARNFRLPGGKGELDIVARDGAALVFVEVKSRATAEFGAPERAVGADKRRLLRAAAQHYLRRSNLECPVRFDIVSVVFSDPPELTHYRDVWRFIIRNLHA